MSSPGIPPEDDIRQKGLSSRSRVQEAWDWIDHEIQPLPAEFVSLNDAHGRALAAEVIAPINVPPFDRSAMDGFALRAQDTNGAGEDRPISFQVIDISVPGKPASRSITPGTCIRIMTGAPLPAGADAVLPVEETRSAGEQMHAIAAIASAKNVGRIGEDIRLGTRLLEHATQLRPQDVAVLASVGLPQVAVIRQPHVRILITGNEIVPPGQTRGPHQIYDANSFLLHGLCQRDGAATIDVRFLPDDRDKLRTAIQEPGADILLISGGSSVGSEDFAPGLIRELGELRFHGMAMRPSSPAGMGRVNGTWVFLLPGNPVSCLCAYDFFAGRGLRRLGGKAPAWPYATDSGRLTKKLVSALGRLDYARVRFTPEGLEPLGIGGASILSSTVIADGFVVIPEELDSYPEGATVTVHRYGSIRGHSH